MDTWQYFMHTLMHHDKFMYKRIHSKHHRLIVPYSFGPLYNSPVEGFLLDTVGGALFFLASGMTPRVSIFFFSFATIKTVDDHCGLWLPRLVSLSSSSHLQPLKLWMITAGYGSLGSTLFISSFTTMLLTMMCTISSIVASITSRSHCFLHGIDCWELTCLIR
ncbi:Sphinganine C(4)-monooxygenase 1 [Spatholobus suberectus]|nr:Sphinganine C(4)-monooxygenase 1 [Spatholobus suberectus]